MIDAHILETSAEMYCVLRRPGLDCVWLQPLRARHLTRRTDIYCWCSEFFHPPEPEAFFRWHKNFCWLLIQKPRNISGISEETQGCADSDSDAVDAADVLMSRLRKCPRAQHAARFDSRTERTEFMWGRLIKRLLVSEQSEKRSTGCETTLNCELDFPVWCCSALHTADTWDTSVGEEGERADGGGIHPCWGHVRTNVDMFKFSSPLVFELRLLYLWTRSFHYGVRTKTFTISWCWEPQTCERLNVL